MTQVACGRCGTEVVVEKSSWHQTTVQWTTAALSRCPALSDATVSHPAFRRCADLHASIHAAVLDGAFGSLD